MMHHNHAGAIIYKAIVAVVCITECLCLLLPEASAIPTNLEPAKDGIVYQPKNKTEKCTGPGLPGPCQGFGDRYRYDQTINNCTVFIWGGCGGNLQNNFETYEQCMQQCTNETHPAFSTGTPPRPSAVPNRSEDGPAAKQQRAPRLFGTQSPNGGVRQSHAHTHTHTAQQTQDRLRAYRPRTTHPAIRLAARQELEDNLEEAHEKGDAKSPFFVYRWKICSEAERSVGAVKSGRVCSELAFTRANGGRADQVREESSVAGTANVDRRGAIGSGRTERPRTCICDGVNTASTLPIRELPEAEQKAGVCCMQTQPPVPQLTLTSSPSPSTTPPQESITQQFSSVSTVSPVPDELRGSELTFKETGYEKTFMFAKNNTFIQMDGDTIQTFQLRLCREISFQFRTRLPHGLLVYHNVKTPAGIKLDPYALYVIVEKGQLKVVHVFGNHSTSVTVGEGLNRDEWHSVMVRIDVHGARLIARVDNHKEEVYLKGLNHETNYGVSINLMSVVLVGGKCCLLLHIPTCPSCPDPTGISGGNVPCPKNAQPILWRRP
ncbi:hypothetical protein pipiens_006336 [Culex pipiens pipiens]|uniref:Uncharacterized protein n=1 Tax=Culex pipiens pipiens TaxID=38569 RepID=A0ABD1DQ36_CULPP